MFGSDSDLDKPLVFVLAGSGLCKNPPLHGRLPGSHEMPAKQTMSRIIAIGDVHGCADEFEELLEALELRPDDRVIQLGDLVNRGPDSHRAVETARQYQVEAVLGNHELRLLTARRERRTDLLKDYDHATIEQLTGEDWAYLEGMTRFRHEAVIDTVFVHGGFLPDEPWHTQPVEVITQIQVIDKRGRPAKRSDEPDAPHWSEKWNSSPFVVYGHTPRPNVVERPGSVGIDTGCVYGGHLTAYCLTDGCLTQVRARRAYAHSKRLPDPV